MDETPAEQLKAATDGARARGKRAGEALRAAVKPYDIETATDAEVARMDAVVDVLVRLVAAQHLSIDEAVARGKRYSDWAHEVIAAVENNPVGLGAIRAKRAEDWAQEVIDAERDVTKAEVDRLMTDLAEKIPEPTTFYLDEVKAGAGPADRGADFAKFRSRGGMGTPHLGTYELYTIDWIKRGRPTEVQIILPEEAS